MDSLFQQKEIIYMYILKKKNHLLKVKLSRMSEPCGCTLAENYFPLTIQQKPIFRATLSACSPTFTNSNPEYITYPNHTPCYHNRIQVNGVWYHDMEPWLWFNMLLHSEDARIKTHHEFQHFSMQKSVEHNIIYNHKSKPDCFVDLTRDSWVLLIFFSFRVFWTSLCKCNL